MKTNASLKNILAGSFRFILLVLAYLLSLILPSLLLPMPEALQQAAPEHGFLPDAMLINALANTLLIYWLCRRSTRKGLALFLQLALPLFLVQTFQTQVETMYFMEAFPALQGNFLVYQLILKGALTAALFAGFAMLIAGRHRASAGEKASFRPDLGFTLRQVSWLALVYIVLYLGFGYFVAWQSQELRLFYGGPAQLDPFFVQIRQVLLDKPELPFFQYARGLLWLVALLHVLSGFRGSRGELLLFAACFLGLMPTLQLGYANPLMPAEVCAFHFVEISLSNGLFGALAAWVLTRPVHGKVAAGPARS